MTSIVYIAGVLLNRKENYQEWSRKLKSALVFNDFWEFCEGRKDSDGNEIAPKPPDNEKQCAIWDKKDNKSYALKIASVT